MKSALVVAMFLLAGTLVASAAPADVTYTEGDATLKLKTGAQQDVQIGDTLNTGDTLRTGADGLAELDQKGVTIKISHGTVFTLMERNQAGQTSTVLSVALGSIKFRYDKLTGSEPQIRTNGAIAGVRGTEFTVFSGADGSTLFAVDSGKVTVESEGKSVDLVANQGVEVPLGQPPGEKISIHSDQVDYSKWNSDKLAAIFADPLNALASMKAAMNGYIKEVAQYRDGLEESTKRLAAEREKRKKIGETEGNAAAAKYEQEVVTPLAVETGYYFLNLRYNALAALSLRRYVGGRLYVLLKARSIAGGEAAQWNDFLAAYQEFLDAFEKSIVPQLVLNDI